jgi:hypothetical protein
MWIFMNLLEGIRQVVAQSPNGSTPAEAGSSVPTSRS